MSWRAAVSAVLVTLGLGLALASLAGWLGTRWWVFELASHFRAQYAGGLGVVVLALAALRRLRWVVVLGPIALANAFALAPYLPRHEAVAGSPRQTLKLVTANLRFRNHDSADLLAILTASEPDVVVLSEYSERWAHDLASLDASYPYRIEVPDPGPWGIAMFSRLPLEEAGSFMLGVTPAVAANLMLAGHRVHLLGVHLRSPTSREHAAERNAQLTELTALAHQSARPLIVLGDFNATQFSPNFATMVGGAGVRDATRGRALLPTWPVFLPMLRIPIDHCLVSGAFTVLETTRLPAFGSDHFALLTVLALEESQ